MISSNPYMNTHRDRRPTVGLITHSTASGKVLEQTTSRCMPTQTVYLTEELYDYVSDTKEPDQSTSQRVRDLVAKGKEAEHEEEG